MMKAKITFNDLMDLESKIEIKLGTIQSVERIPKKDALIKLEVYFDENDTRQVVTNLGGVLENINDLLYLTLPFYTNLEPAKIAGIESQAMVIVPKTIDGKIDLTGKSGLYLM